jgi:hypothetical protein
VVLGEERRDVRIDVAGGLFTVCFLKRSWLTDIVFVVITVISEGMEPRQLL